MPPRWADTCWRLTSARRPPPAARRILSDAKSANERRMASCADLLITSTTMFWQLYPFKCAVRRLLQWLLLLFLAAAWQLVPGEECPGTAGCMRCCTSCAAPADRRERL